MLTKSITVSGTTSQHTLVVPTLYKYVTVFNHSRHRLSFFPDNVTDLRALLYRVPSQIYATLPLIGSGQVASCQREVTYTVVSEGENVSPTTVSLVFSQTFDAVNIPFPDPLTPTVLVEPQYKPMPRQLVSEVTSIQNIPLPTILAHSSKYRLFNHEADIPLGGSVESGVLRVDDLPFYTLRIITSQNMRLDVHEGVNPTLLHVLATHNITANVVFTHTGRFFLNHCRFLLTNLGGAVSTCQFAVFGQLS